MIKTAKIIIIGIFTLVLHSCTAISEVEESEVNSDPVVSRGVIMEEVRKNIAPDGTFYEGYIYRDRFGYLYENGAYVGRDIENFRAMLSRNGDVMIDLRPQYFPAPDFNERSEKVDVTNEHGLVLKEYDYKSQTPVFNKTTNTADPRNKRNGINTTNTYNGGFRR